MPVALFAGIYVRDHGLALPWYVRLLGEPGFHPSGTETVWALAPERWVYVQQNTEHAGHSVVTIFPEDLEDTLAEIRARGLVASRHEDYPGGVRKAVFIDADGNEIGLAGVSSASGRDA